MTNEQSARAERTLKDLVRRTKPRVGCGVTTGHGTTCSKPWLCESCETLNMIINEIESLYLPMGDGYLVTVNDAAEILDHIYPGAIRAAIRRGTIASVLTPNGERRITLAEVERYRRENLKKIGRPRKSV